MEELSRELKAVMLLASSRMTILELLDSISPEQYEWFYRGYKYRQELDIELHKICCGTEAERG